MYADDLGRLLRILADAPAEGLSLYVIQKRTESEGERWSLMDINKLLCDLGNRVTHQKIRSQFGKVTVYALRRPGS